MGTPGTASPRPSDGTIRADVAVIGGGVVGHAIAWEAQRSGRSVALIDDAPGSGASWAAAGMLAPVSELHYQEEDLLDLMLASSARWPRFIADLAAASGERTGYLTTPTLAVGADAADRRALMDLRAVQQANGLAVGPLTVREARRREPLLSPGIACALDTPADHQVDPRLVVSCLRNALAGEAAGSGGRGAAVAGAVDGYAVPDKAHGLLWAGGTVAGVRLAGGGTVLAGETVVANGLDAAALADLPDGLHLPLRPVYGDILRLAVPRHLQPLVTATVRGLVRGVPVYIVPREDGTVVIGATQREDALAGAGAAPPQAVRSGAGAVSAGGVYQLLRDAQVLVPAVAELELLECTARARPATPDNAPMLGRVPAAPGSGPGGHIAGLIIATGFFRHGVLLSPAAGTICRDLMDGAADPRWEPFNPGRFSGRESSAASVNIKETA